MEKERTREKIQTSKNFQQTTQSFHTASYTQQHGGERFYKMFCLLFFILFFILVYNNSSLKNHFLEFLLSRAFGLQFFFFLLSLLFFNIIFSHFVQHFLLYWILFFSWFLLWHLFERTLCAAPRVVGMLYVVCMNFIHVSFSPLLYAPLIQSDSPRKIC